MTTATRVREPVFDIAGVAELAGVKVETVHQWRWRKLLPPPDVSLRRGPLWYETTIRHWLEETGRVRAR